MAIELFSIFGTEIKVTAQPRTIERQYSAFPGCSGLTAMHMGARGYELVVTGVMRMLSRPALEAAVRSVESWLFAPALDYIYYGTVHPAVLWESMELQSDDGRSITWCFSGWYICRFIMRGRSII